MLLLDDNNQVITDYTDVIVSIETICGEQLYRLSTVDQEVSIIDNYVICIVGKEKTMNMQGVYLLNFGIKYNEDYIIGNSPIKICIHESNIAHETTSQSI